MDLPNDAYVSPAALIVAVTHLDQVPDLQFILIEDKPASKGCINFPLRSIGICSAPVEITKPCFLHDVVDPAAAVRDDMLLVMEEHLFKRNVPPPAPCVAAVESSVLVAVAPSRIEFVRSGTAHVVGPPDGINAHHVLGDLLEFTSRLHVTVTSCPFGKHPAE